MYCFLTSSIMVVPINQYKTSHKKLINTPYLQWIIYPSSFPAVQLIYETLSSDIDFSMYVSQLTFKSSAQIYPSNSNKTMYLKKTGKSPIPSTVSNKKGQKQQNNVQKPPHFFPRENLAKGLKVSYLMIDAFDNMTAIEKAELAPQIRDLILNNAIAKPTLRDQFEQTMSLQKPTKEQNCSEEKEDFRGWRVPPRSMDDLYLTSIMHSYSQHGKTLRDLAYNQSIRILLKDKS